MKQYIDFYRDSRDTIFGGCSHLVNSCRDAAIAKFSLLGFPNADIEKLLKEDYGFYLKPAADGFNPKFVFHCDVPNLDSDKCFAVNGHFFEEENAPQSVNNSKDCFSGSLHRFAELFPDIFKKYYNSLAEERGTGMAAFNTAFVQGGYVLYVPDNVSVEKTVQMTNVSSGTAVSLVNRRMLIILGRNAKARLLVCDHTLDDKPLSASTQVTEIFAEDNSKFYFCELEESSQNTVRIAETFAQQKTGSTLSINSITLSNGTTHNDTTVDLTGPNASLHLGGMAIVDKKQIINNCTLINHLSPDCKSNELYKYVLEDEATGVFNGKIVVAKDAQKTEAFQTNRNLLGSRRCRMFSQPQLEIYADDVKCSHGMTTGQLDEQALFYMRQRGIPLDEATMLLKFAFMSDVIQDINIEGLRERLKMLIEKRFRGELATCRGCNSNLEVRI